MSVQALLTSATGMAAMETKLDVIANNMANMETTGFKKDRVNFEDLFYRIERMPGTQDSASNLTPDGIQVGMGVRVQSTQTCNIQGSSQKTGNELDWAIQGRGYFKLTDPVSNEVVYTRAGNFSLNSQGQIVSASAYVGRLLEPQISIPPDATNISVSSEGIVSIQQAGQQQMQQVGQLELAQFINPEGLLKMGENIYKQTDASGQPQNSRPGQDGLGTVQQGFLEASNVEPVEELVELIKTQRAFEMNSQMVQAGDQMMQQIANLRRY
jgi:flagellar basal-body rod protein FlgG